MFIEPLNEIRKDILKDKIINLSKADNLKKNQRFIILHIIFCVCVNTHKNIYNMKVFLKVVKNPSIFNIKDNDK